MSDIRDILIVGAGQAGGCAAAALRSEGFTGRIVLAGAEPYRPYERPPLSKEVLADASADDAIFLHKPEFHDSLGLEWHPNLEIVHIDTERRSAASSDGRAFPFDRCLIATGGRARRLPGVADNLPNVFHLRTLDDARRLRERLLPGSSAVVIGAGFLGLEFAGVAARKGVSVTVLEAGEQILGRTAPRLFADWLAACYEKEGVRILCGVTLRRLEADANGTTVTLADGQELKADFTLVAIGQEPNVTLARGAGIALDNGIAVDARCETSVPGIFSIGDCASHPSAFLGRRVRLESWQSAQEQARVAARAMLGQEACYDAVPWFWSDQLGLNIQMLGLPDPSYSYCVRGDPDSRKFLVFGCGDRGLRYALAVNSGGDIRPLRNLLEANAAVDAATLMDTTRSIREIAKTALS